MRGLLIATVALVGLATLACSATLVSVPEPAATPARLGIIEYPAVGFRGVQARRHADAERRMTAACGGPFKIELNEVHRGPVRVIPVSRSLIFVRPSLRYIAFSCAAQ